MTWLLLGVLVLAVLVLARNWLATVNPVSAARALRWTGVAALVAVAAYLAATGRIALDAPMLLFLVPQVRRWLSAQTQRVAGSSAPPPGGTSDVRTATLHMTLDHGSGVVTGRVVAGRFAGRTLSDLDVPQVLDLLTECRGTDEESVPLVEAYLDRINPEWRDEARTSAKPSADGPMTREEAYQILELNAGASADDVRAAHHRLMKKLHPDQGGSTYLASKVNQAKDLLLG